MELQVPGGDAEHDPIHLHQLFTAFVADNLRTKSVIIIIDEAQNLDNSALETLRLLSNFEAAEHKLLHIILAGQPQLGEKLRSPSLTQLLQRITTISRLERFSPAQMQECIEFRLRVAGYKGTPPFTNEAMAKIMAASGGVPREINRICINALQLGFALRQKKISIEVIEEVLSDLFLSREAETEISKEVRGTESQPAVGIEQKSSIAPAEPKIPRIFDEPWVSHTPVESCCLSTLPPRERQKDSPEEVARPQSAVQVQTPDLRNAEKQLPVISHSRFPYTFAMGCVPRPAQASVEVQSAVPTRQEQTRGVAAPNAVTGTDGVAPGTRELRVAGGSSTQHAVPSTWTYGK
jgi:hypothetical protein